MASHVFAPASLDFELINNRLSRLFSENGHATGPVPAPAASLQETSEGLVLTMDLPGLQREAIEVQMENGTLVVQGTMTEPASEGRYHLQERVYGSFRRTFRMPNWVESERITADLENGVLTVRLPKVAAAQPRRIEIGGNPNAA